MFPVKTKVIKRDGRKEVLVPEKIVVSLLRAGLDLENARKIAISIVGDLIFREEVESKELARKISNLLKRIDENAYKRWFIFMKYLKSRRKVLDKELNSSLKDYLKK